MENVYFYDTGGFTYDEDKVGESIKQLFELMELDYAHIGCDEWNPLCDIIKPHQKVLIKPNLVMDYNQSGEGVECLYTQVAVTKAILKYVFLALEGTGSVIVGDAPMQECDFAKLIHESGYEDMIRKCQAQGYNIELVDFRELTTNKIKGIRHQVINNNTYGQVIDLKEESEFAVYDEKHLNNMRITNYSPDRLMQHHTVGKHEYFVSRHVLDADVVINIPKPKTHRKAGVTIALKNMVGINVRKEYLPHHTLGSIERDGDQYKKDSALKRISSYCIDKKNEHEGKNQYTAAKCFMLLGGGLKFLYMKIAGDSLEGNWSGNNTISKTIVDLNKILIYANRDGEMCEQPQRKVLNIADMIVSGEKEGPVAPSPKNVGYIVAGENSVSFDMAIATMMGANIDKVPTIQSALSQFGKYRIYKEKKVFVKSNNPSIDGREIADIETKDRWMFIPTRGWRDVFL